MRLTILLLTATFLQVNAKGWSQEKVTLNLKNASIEKLFTEIRKQTAFDFLYRDDLVQNLPKITIVIKDATINEVLNKCFEGLPITYAIEGSNIIIKERENSVVKTTEARIVPPIDVSGRVVNENGSPVANVTILVKGKMVSTISNSNGEFSLSTIDEDAILVFTHISMQTFELKVSGQKQLLIKLKTKISELGDVTVTVSTGYQDMPKERATGSFVKIDNKTINQQTGTNVLKRLEGVTSGLLFNNNKIRGGMSSPTDDNITIRGVSTIEASMDPLVILDGFIYEGGINNLNPNDVESITILKDAAATSIWGARAGNGVIVISTKKGAFNQKLKVEINSNVIVSEKPDLFYLPEMSSSDYIDVEEFLFNKGFYNAQINSKFFSLTPAVEVLLNRRNGLLSAEDSASQINELKAIDSRNQYNRYGYRNAVTQQYSLNLSGGSSNNAYTISVGYDNTIGELRNQFNKLNLRVENIYQPLKNLQIHLGAYFTNSKANSGMAGYGNLNVAGRGNIPYVKLSDESGTALPVNLTYRNAFVDTAGGGKLLDWKYYPLDEWKHNTAATNLQELYTRVGVKYKLAKFLNIDLKYQYQRQQEEQDQVATLESYYSRDLINTFSQLDRTTGIITYIVPNGSIRTLRNNFINSYTARGQLNFDHSWGDHSLTSIVGAELRQVKTYGNSFTAYGYNEDPLINTPVDFRTTYPTFITGDFNGIPGAPGFSSSIYKFVSLYGNSAYTFKNRYTFSVSARRDGSNIFGVNTNDKWKPLWSTGFKWKLSKEAFYKSDFIPQIDIRITYGFSGNIDLSKTALPIANYATTSVTGFRYARITTLNNPDLRWEKSGMFNIGLDFSLISSIISGSIEYYRKKGTDLYGPSLYDYTVWGRTSEVTINAADLQSKGVDVVLNSKIIDRKFKWFSSFLFNYNTDKVTKYYGANAEKITSKLGSGIGIDPVIGKPLYGIAAYKWGGLDANGMPQGFVDGKLSVDYLAIIAEGNVKGLNGNIVYFGPSNPPFFGAISNTFFYKNFEVSFLLNYKLGYYFKKEYLSYQVLVNNGRGHADYAKRWKKPGDEAFTEVPSFIYPLNVGARRADNFYSNAAVHVLKGDHIRLQYINLSYTIDKARLPSLPFRSLQLYTNAANVGIIWRDNNLNLDPDYPTSLRPGSRYTFGLRADF